MSEIPLYNDVLSNYHCNNSDNEKVAFADFY